MKKAERAIFIGFEMKSESNFSVRRFSTSTTKEKENFRVLKKVLVREKNERRSFFHKNQPCNEKA